LNFFYIKKREHLHLLYGLGVIIVVLFLYNSSYFIFSVSDDLSVINLLKAGEYRTDLLNHFTSIALVWLYTHWPSIPWYSWLCIFCYILALEIICYVCLTKLKEYGLFFTPIVLTAAIFQYQGLSITILTGLLFASAILVVSKNWRLSILVVSLAVFLRFKMAVMLFFPIYAIIFLTVVTGLNFDRAKLFFTYEIFSKKTILPLSLLLVALASNTLYYGDEEYEDWRNFKASATDIFDQPVQARKIYKNEMLFMGEKGWYWDEEIFPSDIVQDKRESHLKKVLFQFSNVSEVFESVGQVFSNHKKWWCLIALLAIFMLIQSRRLLSPPIISSYMCVIIAVIAVVSLRDQERVTNSLLLVLVCAGVMLLNHSKSMYLSIVLLGALMHSYEFYGNRPEFFSIDYGFQERCKKIGLVNSKDNAIFSEFKDYNLIPAIAKIPADKLRPKACLGDEYLAARNYFENVFPLGWLSRHPYFNNKLYGDLGFSNWYEFITDSQTLFFARSLDDTASDRVRQFTLIYDEYYKGAHRFEVAYKRDGIFFYRFVSLDVDK
jgi:hypothetical protein